MRLSARQWLVVAVVALIGAFAVPALWKRVERFPTGPDYRIPYAISSDYWLYQRRLEKIPEGTIPVVGDSVVWGEYVRANGTLSHFLNVQAGRPDRFANCGVNGVFPLALEGLLDYYGGPIGGRKVVLQYNMLWMSSPKADLSTEEEQTFNHAMLVPQLFTKIPCYRADAVTRLGAMAERSIGMCGWVQHIDDVYFDGMSIPAWTLQPDNDNPSRSPNAWRNPLARITMRVPGEPAVDPQRGPGSSRHKPWTAGGAAPQSFEWVGLRASLQWAAFRRTVARLKARGCDVMVILGPFNEHMVAPEQRPQYRQMRDGIAAWLGSQRIPHVVPDTLPSDLYADASHPLTEGYDRLASRIYSDPSFQSWLAAK
jgi:hypothetical protein